MGRIRLFPPTGDNTASVNPLPGVLQTPSGLALLEIQGTLNSTKISDSVEHGQPSFNMGRLSFPLYNPLDGTDKIDWQKKVHLYVGNDQRLTGELKKLPSPIAIIRKRSSSQEDGTEDLEMVDLIYYKLMFTHRPEPFGTTVNV